MEVDIRKKLGSFNLDVRFTAEKSCLGILGASGCGKSMTLKCIAGIVTPDEGRIVVNGRVLYDSEKRINIKPQKRKVGYLFQDYALFPTLTAYGNIVSGLGRVSAQQQKKTAGALIEQFHLQGLEKHYPHQLSGGQQQRVALARIIACDPDVILLDEPFSALDSHLRLKMQLEVKEVLKKYDNSIMVTHNREEAYKLCSDLLILDSGKVSAAGKTEQLFSDPRTVEAAMLTGCKNISRIERLGVYELRALDWGGLILRVSKPLDDKISHIGIHSNKFVPVTGNDNNTDNLIRLSVIDEITTPTEKQIVFQNADGQSYDPQTDILWECDKNTAPTLPDYLRLPPEDLLLLGDR